MTTGPRAELEVLRGMLEFETPALAGVRVGLSRGAVEALCRKWEAAGWYTPAASGVDRGHLTAAGRVAVNGLLVNGA